MLSTTSASPKARLRVSLRGRSISFLLALAIEILIALLLLWMAPHITPKEKPRPVVFGLDSNTGQDEPAAKAEPKAQKAHKRAGQKAEEQTQPQQQAAETPPPPVTTPQTNGPRSFILMSRRDYAAADISNLAPAKQGDSGETAETDGGGSADSERAGTGPHGQVLYAADWYRHPTDAQLSPYISERALGRDGWGEIACRTISRYQVTDCQELGEYPVGSGYAGAVRQAAFQFLVKPPQVNGKVMVGTWVRIRITYTRRGGRGE